ncbi:hypothetical protein [Listeria booriae]|nr:hypothetical protein [Listeria booriae]MBC1525466.1 hypothetical protein [Listeria booriae]MBC1893118.1 hypothetical protein [Listeria booriae]MBC1974522.1 hypothetical protein [Listeria booriae]MBC1983451.1 hypothetical protein [Listeria booriae]MBC2031814.1 hypothetical protein [Listeria booriae]
MENEIKIPERLHQKMAEFFAKTSAPRILEKMEREETNLKIKENKKCLVH